MKKKYKRLLIFFYTFLVLNFIIAINISAVADQGVYSYSNKQSISSRDIDENAYYIEDSTKTSSSSVRSSYGNSMYSDEYNQYSAPSLISGLSEVDDPELSADDWNILTERESESGSFDFIKNSEGFDADESKWMMYVGFALIGLSLIGIVYLIIDHIRYKKKEKLERSKTRHRVDRVSHRVAKKDTQSLDAYRDIRNSSNKKSQFKEKSDWDDFFKN